MDELAAIRRSAIRAPGRCKASGSSRACSRPPSPPPSIDCATAPRCAATPPAATAPSSSRTSGRRAPPRLVRVGPAGDGNYTGGAYLCEICGRRRRKLHMDGSFGTPFWEPAP